MIPFIENPCPGLESWMYHHTYMRDRAVICHGGSVGYYQESKDG